MIAVVVDLAIYHQQGKHVASATRWLSLRKLKVGALKAVAFGKSAQRLPKTHQGLPL